MGKRPRLHCTIAAPKRARSCKSSAKGCASSLLQCLKIPSIPLNNRYYTVLGLGSKLLGTSLLHQKKTASGETSQPTPADMDRSLQHSQLQKGQASITQQADGRVSTKQTANRKRKRTLRKSAKATEAANAGHEEASQVAHHPAATKQCHEIPIPSSCCGSAKRDGELRFTRFTLG